MAKQLARLKVDVIEAGFPVASPGDFEAVEYLANHVEGPVIAGLSRAKKDDIDVCWRAIQGAKRTRIHTFIASSDIHLKYKFNASREEVLKMAVDAVEHAKKYTDNVEFSAEDATRSDRKYLAQLVEATIEAGATTVNIPDTVGYTIPSEYGSLIRYLREHVKNIDRAVISVHCHNDLGLAVANSLAAIQNGARQVECTINGIGERAGNASMEEIVMALKVREQTLNLDTGIDTEQIYSTSKLLSHITGIKVQPNKAIVGANAFAHESGIHQDGLLKSEMTYSIMTPQSIGLSEHQMVLGKHSGRAALRSKLQDMGYDLSEDDFMSFFNLFKELADKKKEVYDDDIHVLVASMSQDVKDRFQLGEVEISSGTHKMAEARVQISIDGSLQEGQGQGDGPVDAIFAVIRKLTGFTGRLNRFSVNAITGGADAQGEVTVEVERDGRIVRGVGSHTDIVVASAKAYVNALNRLETAAREVEVHM